MQWWVERGFWGGLSKGRAWISSGSSTQERGASGAAGSQGRDISTALTSHPTSPAVLCPHPEVPASQ